MGLTIADPSSLDHFRIAAHRQLPVAFLLLEDAGFHNTLYGGDLHACDLGPKSETASCEASFTSAVRTTGSRPSSKLR
jgi:hypothetical protein